MQITINIPTEKLGKALGSAKGAAVATTRKAKGATGGLNIKARLAVAKFGIALADRAMRGQDADQ